MTDTPPPPAPAAPQGTDPEPSPTSPAVSPETATVANFDTKFLYSALALVASVQTSEWPPAKREAANRAMRDCIAITGDDGDVATAITGDDLAALCEKLDARIATESPEAAATAELAASGAAHAPEAALEDLLRCDELAGPAGTLLPPPPPPPAAEATPKKRRLEDIDDGYTDVLRAPKRR